MKDESHAFIAYWASYFRLTPSSSHVAA